MSHPITGTFRITHMDEWDQDFVDAEVEGYIRFDPDGFGEFQFGYVHGDMTCEQTERDGKPAVEWSWEGNDEMEPSSGRGWAVLQDDGCLQGKLFFHSGDSSGFTAAKKKTKKPKPKIQKIPIANLRMGPIRNASLPYDLLKRIRAIHTALKGIYDVSLEQMELNFMRDLHPADEVALWERIMAGLEKASKAMPKLDRKMIMTTLLGYSMGGRAAVDMKNPDVKKILRIAEGK
jgi:hypothetical protein